MGKLALGLHPKNGMPIKAMIVDDSKTIRLLLKQILLSEKFEIVLEATDGEDAIRQLRETPEKPALYFSDIEMPNKNGLEALKEIRTFAPNMKAIMITGVKDEQMVKEAISLGIEGYIVKPDGPTFNRKEFLEKLARILKRNDYLSQSA